MCRRRAAGEPPAGAVRAVGAAIGGRAASTSSTATAAVAAGPTVDGHAVRAVTTVTAGTTAAASHSCARVAVQCHSTIQGECTPSHAGPGDDRVAGERENASCKNSVRVWSGRTVLNLDHS